MLRIQAALWLSTGSLEMSVFQMLSAGNIGQSGAPGTRVEIVLAWPALGWAARAPLVRAAVAANARIIPVPTI